MQVTITRSVDYVISVEGGNPLDCARSAMATFGAMSPEQREEHASAVEELWLTTGTLETADCRVFTAKDLQNVPSHP
jgi:hypothetical protein